MALDLSRMKRLVSWALENGASRKSATRVEWDLAGNCQSPVPREIHVRPSPARPAREPLAGQGVVDAILKAIPGAEIVRDDRSNLDRPYVEDRRIRVSRDTALPLTLAMHVRCRKCDKCRALRRMTWAMRAKAETMVATRTWFGTLTLNPAAHLVAVSKARVRLAEQGVDFDGLAFGEQFTERVRAISPEITRYLKRIRKESGACIRTLVVVEHHKSGLPHYHMLVHEHVGAVKHSTLSKQWQLGFEKWRLVSDAREATYLCKYLSKATVARVRASRGYGSPPKVIGAMRRETQRDLQRRAKSEIETELKERHVDGISSALQEGEQRVFDGGRSKPASGCAAVAIPGER